MNKDSSSYSNLKIKDREKFNDRYRSILQAV